MILVALLGGAIVTLLMYLFGTDVLAWIILATVAGGWAVKRWVDNHELSEKDVERLYGRSGPLA